MKKISVNVEQSPVLPWVDMIKDAEDLLEVSLFDGDEAVEVLEAYIDGKKPYGENVAIPSKIENGKIVADVKPEVVDQIGKILCEITMKEKKAYFFIYVEDIRQ